MRRALSRKNLWEHAPRPIKALVGGALRAIPLPLLLGGRFRQTRRFLDEAQWWPHERSQQYQLEHLQEILRLAYENTAYYRRTFDDAGFRPEDLTTLAEMTHLPTIDKNVVVSHLAEMCAVPPESANADLVSTGGTSGPPLRFYMPTYRSAVEFAYLTTSWGRVGYRLGTPLATIRGRMVTANADGLHYEYDPLLRHHYYSNFHMAPGAMRAYLRHIATLGPCFLHAYPTSADALGRFAMDAGVPRPENIKGIIVESETVNASDRAFAESVFGCRYFSCYGHSEKLVLAVECEHTSDYHVWPTYGYFELLDPQGRPVTTPGQQGEIVGTGFINTIVPFIRYRTGDYATYVGEACEACGRQHTVLRDIQGRWPQGNLLATDGSAVSMTALNMHDDTLLNVREYQFVQGPPGRAVLRIVPARELLSQERSLIEKNVNQRLQGRVTVALEVVHEIEKTARGKTPRVIHAPDAR